MLTVVLAAEKFDFGYIRLIEMVLLLASVMMFPELIVSCGKEEAMGGIVMVPAVVEMGLEIEAPRRS